MNNKLKEAVTFAKALIGYKNKKGFGVKLRVALQRADGKFIKWVDEDEFLQKEKEILDDYTISSLHMTKVPNQLVLELDIEDEKKRTNEYQKLFKYLQIKKWKYIPIWSGNKSIHIHVFFKVKTLDEAKSIREFVVSSLSKVLEGFDVHITNVSTPFRLPGSFHHKSGNYADILIVDENTLELANALKQYNINSIINILINMENDIIIPNINNQKSLNMEGHIEQRLKRRKHRKSKLYSLYNDLLQTKIEDGRDRILMILVTIAKFLNIPSDQFEKDITEWAQLNEWKTYRWRRWIDYYKEERYKWMKNWRWAIKQFLLSSDISEKDYNKVREIIGKYLPWALEKWKR